MVGENPAAEAIMGAKDVPTGDGACVRTRQSAPCALSARRRAEHRIGNGARCRGMERGANESAVRGEKTAD